MLKLYNHELSGNCHKVRLMLSLLGLEYEIVPVDVLRGENKSPQFLELNPFGFIPVLIDGDAIVRDSQAILVYLTKAYGGEDWLPGKAESMSKVVQWLSIAANEIQNSLVALRLHFLFNAQIDLELAQQKARQLLQVMDAHLAQRQWLEMDRPTIADVACYPYIKLAADARVSLEAYPNVIKWLDRIEQLPGYVSLV